MRNADNGKECVLTKVTIKKHLILPIFVAGFLISPTIGAQVPMLRDIRSFYIEGYDKAIGDDRRVADCLITKLKERGSFAFENSKEAAEAILRIDTTIRCGSSRILCGNSPSVHMTVLTLDERILWKCENKYKKGYNSMGRGNRYSLRASQRYCRQTCEGYAGKIGNTIVIIGF